MRLLTEAELRNIHRSFGHPSIRATEGLLKRESGRSLSTHVRRSIERIAAECKPYSTYATAYRRFKLTVGSDDLRFNHSVKVDAMFLLGRPVHHIIDMATHFCAAPFLKSQSAREIWTKIQLLWTLVYSGPSDHLSVDQGSSFISREMRANLESDGVTLHEAPIENPGSIGTFER